MNKLRVLTFTTLYPNEAMPTFATFVEQRLRQLVASGEVDTRVVAPVPWFPFKAERFEPYARYARIPIREMRHGLDLWHPRFLVVPKVGMLLTPFTLFRAAIPAVNSLMAEGFDFDLIDAHYLYPDGVCGAMLARRFGKPLILTARGSDVNVIAKMRRPGRMIFSAIDHANAVITVSAALRDSLIGLGVDSAKITVIRNGVDTTLFRETDREETRRKLGIEGRLLISVGNLIPLKGALEGLAREMDVSGRVTFVGAVPQSELPALYSAADALILASSNEGLPNVIMEAIACGTPVIATKVGGIPEIIDSRAAGIVLEERSDSAIADAVTSLFSDPPGRIATAKLAENFRWSETTAAQLALFRRIVDHAAIAS